MAGPSPQRQDFDPRPVRVGSAMGKVALGQILLRILRFYSVSIIPTVLHTRSIMYH